MTTGTLLVGAGGAGALAGSLLPWVTYAGFSVSGLNLGSVHGPLALAGGVAALIGAGLHSTDRQRYSWAWLLGLGGGAVAFGVIATLFMDISNAARQLQGLGSAFSSSFSVDIFSLVGLGFWLTGAAGLLAAIGGLIARGEIASEA